MSEAFLLIAKVLAEIVERNDDETYLILGPRKNVMDGYRAALVMPIWGGGIAPLFDPATGEHALAGTGDTPAAALAALAATLARTRALG